MTMTSMEESLLSDIPSPMLGPARRVLETVQADDMSLLDNLVFCNCRQEESNHTSAVNAGNQQCCRHFTLRGYTLYFASAMGKVECVQHLMNCGLALEDVSKNCVTEAVLKATSAGHAQCLDLLLRNGASLDGLDSEGNSPLVLAVREQHEGCFRVILRASRERNDNVFHVQEALGTAAIRGRVDFLQLLLETGAEIDGISSFGGSAFLNAGLLGYIPCLQFLLDQGANINQEDSTTGETALFSAIRNGRADCAELLLTRGANIHHRQRKKKTGIMVATMLKDNSCLKLLLSHGADVNATEVNGLTPVMYACLYGSVACVRALVENGADVNARTRLLEQTACMVAANAYRPGGDECLHYLLSHGGAEVNATNVNGETALTFALLMSHVDCVRLLLDHGANAAGVDRNGISNLEQSLGFVKTSSQQVQSSEACVDLILNVLPQGEETKRQVEKSLRKIFMFDDVKTLRRFLLRIDKFPFITFLCEKNFQQLIEDGERSTLRELVVSGIYPNSGIFSPDFSITAHGVSCLQYLILNNCLSPRDVAKIQKQNTSDWTEDQRFPQSEDRVCQIPLKADPFRSPWPLAKLCLSVVSSLFGSGPQRKERINMAGFPNTIRRKLAFETDAARLCPSKWTEIKIPRRQSFGGRKCPQGFPADSLEWPLLLKVAGCVGDCLYHCQNSSEM